MFESLNVWHLNLDVSHLIFSLSLQVGIEVKFKAMRYPVLLCPTSVPELTSLTVTPTGLRVGAAVTLARIEEWVEQQEHSADEKRKVELRPLVVSTYLCSFDWWERFWMERDYYPQPVTLRPSRAC